MTTAIIFALALLSSAYACSATLIANAYKEEKRTEANGRILLIWVSCILWGAFYYLTHN